MDRRMIVPLWILITILFVLVTSCKTSQKQEEGKKAMRTEDIRKAVVAGQFYPAEPENLRAMVQTFLENSKLVPVEGEIIGLISPHAGYPYSGYTAAHAYKQIQGKKFDAVVIVAPSHQEMISGASVWNKGGYETPLGIVPVDEALANAIIAQNKGVQFSLAGHRMEHSLEVQLPFLQLVLPELKIVPIVIQDYSVKNCQRVAEAITGAIGNKNVLLLASSDLYHGYSYQECQATDARTLAKIEELEPEKFLQGCADGTYSACGAGPIAVVQMVAKNLGANKARVIHQTNSNDVTGQKGGYVVGYGAVVIYKEGKKMEPKERKVGVDMGLSDDEKKQLLEIARTTIEHRVRGQEVPPVKVTSEILREKRGAFVTINKHGNLRGCIGYVLPYQPLYITIQEMAEAAALRDPRFPPVTPDELDDLEIEISVLTPVREIKDINEIEVGKHGIIIEKGGYSGLLLPQVATEYGWDRITFLEHTCNKAGLPKNAWKEKGTVIKIFSADVFGEK